MDRDSILNQLCERYPGLTSVKESIGRAAEIIIGCFNHGGKLLVCGNGGSSSDSEHLAGD